MDKSRERAASIDRGRYWRIIRFFARSILGFVWCDILVGRVAPSWARRSRPDRMRRAARRFRELAVRMGGVMIKAGQFLSSRVDVLPPEVTEELAGLQDEVPPEPSDAVRQVIQEELNQSPEALFDRFEIEPQAAASLGQTHRAWLPGPDGEPGEAVVLKVQRLNIEQLVETDLAALRVVARWLMLYKPIRRRANVPALVEEFARTTWEEIDYLAEADNAERFAEMFAGDAGVRVPAVHRAYTTRRVLLLENVESIKITDFEGIEASGVRRSAVGARLFDTYLRQIFEEGFFHADPHPGNLFVEPLGDPDGVYADGRPFRLTFVDFGMVGQVPLLVGDQLREIILALVLRDARRLVEAFKKLGFLLPSADMERVEEATAHFLHQFWGMNMEEMAQVDHADMQALAFDFRDLLFEFPFQVPKDFVFLGRAIGILSGMATSLDPLFNPWNAIEEYGKGLIGQRQALGQTIKAVVDALRPLASLPVSLDSFLSKANRGTLEIKATASRSLDRRLRGIERSADRLFWGIVFAALLAAGTLLYLDDQVVLGIASWSLAGGSLLAGLIGGRARR